MLNVNDKLLCDIFKLFNGVNMSKTEIIKGVPRKEYMRLYMRDYIKKHRERINKRQRESAKRRYRLLKETQPKRLKEIHKRRNKKHNLKIKQLILNTLGFYVCQNCGYYKCIHALEVHHINGKKKEEQKLSKIKIKELIEYLEKNRAFLKILCSNCHKEKHYCSE